MYADTLFKEREVVADLQQDVSRIVNKIEQATSLVDLTSEAMIFRLEAYLNLAYAALLDMYDNLSVQITEHLS